MRQSAAVHGGKARDLRFDGLGRVGRAEFYGRSSLFIENLKNGSKRASRKIKMGINHLKNDNLLKIM